MKTKQQRMLEQERIYRKQSSQMWGKALEECQSDKKKFWIKDKENTL